MATVRAALGFHLIYAVIAAVHLAVRLDARPDFQMIELPTMVKLAEAVRRGRLHYWDPSILGGIPLFGSAMYPILSPYNLLLLVLPPDVVFVIMPSLLRALGATGAFHCLHRRLRLGVPASLFGGMLYSTLSVVDDHVFLDYWAVHVIPALLPWLHAMLLAGVERRRASVVGVSAGAVLAAMFYVGGLHFLPYVVMFFVATVVALPVLAPVEERPSPRFAASVLVLALAVFLGLAAFQLLPTLQYVGEAIRTDYNRAAVNAYLFRAAADRLLFDVLPLVRFKLDPPYLAAVNVVGAAAVVFLAAALRVHFARALAPPWFRFHVRLVAFLAVANVLYELGRLVPGLRTLPLYGLNMQYSLFVGDFLRALIVAVGFDALLGGRVAVGVFWARAWSGVRHVLMVGTLAFPLLLPLLYGPLCALVERVLPLLHGRHRTTEFLRAFCTPLPAWMWILAAVVGVLQAAWLLRLRPDRVRGLASAALMLTVLGAYQALAIANTNFLRGLPFEEAGGRTREAAFMRTQPPTTRYFVECLFGDQRNYSFHSFCGEVLWLVGARQWGGLEPLTPRRLMQTIRTLSDDPPNFSYTIAFMGPLDLHRYDWLAYDYALTYAPLTRRADEFDLVFRGDRYHVYRPRRPTPRVMLYGAWVVEADPERRLAVLGHSDAATSDAVVLDAPPPVALGPPPPVALGPPPPVALGPRAARPRLTAEVLGERDEEVRLRVDAEAAGILVFNANHYPGWRAWVDGAPVDVFYANHFMRGVVVPAGRHEVTYRFVSGPVRLGLAITLVTLGALGVAVVVVARSKFTDIGASSGPPAPR